MLGLDFIRSIILLKSSSMEVMFSMIHSSFHKRKNKLILSVTQTHVGTIAGGAWKSKQNSEGMFKLIT